LNSFGPCCNTKLKILNESNMLKRRICHVLLYGPRSCMPSLMERGGLESINNGNELGHSLHPYPADYLLPLECYAVQFLCDEMRPDRSPARAKVMGRLMTGSIPPEMQRHRGGDLSMIRHLPPLYSVCPFNHGGHQKSPTPDVVHCDHTVSKVLHNGRDTEGLDSSY